MPKNELVQSARGVKMSEEQREVKVAYLTSSRIVVGGKSGPYGRPVEGSIERGEVVPKGDPKTFAQKMKKRVGSKAFPQPKSGAHLHIMRHVRR